MARNAYFILLSCLIVLSPSQGEHFYLDYVFRNDHPKLSPYPYQHDALEERQKQCKAWLNLYYFSNSFSSGILR
jgi:hypothetical protein